MGGRKTGCLMRWRSHLTLVGRGGKTFYDLDVLAQRAQFVGAVPGNAVIAVDGGSEGPKHDSGMRQFLDVLTGKADAQSLRHEGHQGAFELGILEYPRAKANLLTGTVKPFPKAGMGLLRHTDKEQVFEVGEFDLASARQPVFGG